ncbi:hypothetical protein BHE74_00030722 [Ensete ventricosum]|nr:hypothetical protein BHE74_00030722 [Ensete ventricosum]RZS24177.1 hypothetical protein BHM03_00057220 [Ensete ventricosum]
MISLLPLQEFMSLTSVHRKLRASTPCFILYIDSLHETWALHQILAKLFRSSVCIKLIVALTPTIPRVSPLLRSISISALRVSSVGVA